MVNPWIYHLRALQCWWAMRTFTIFEQFAAMWMELDHVGLSEVSPKKDRRALSYISFKRQNREETHKCPSEIVYRTELGGREGQGDG